MTGAEPVTDGIFDNLRIRSSLTLMFMDGLGNKDDHKATKALSN